MSKNRRKKTYSSELAEGDALSARVVTIPKFDDSEDDQDETDTAIPMMKDTLPEDKPLPEPVVVLQQPQPEKEIRVALSEPKPKASKQRPKSERIGDLLRDARLKRGDDLYLIAEYLCIKPSFLIALENSRYDEFPADAYVIGFLRTYANFLGINGKDAVDRYRYEMAGRRKKPILSMPTPVSEGRTPSGIVMIGAALALILTYGLWSTFSSSNRAEVQVAPPLPTALQPVPTTAATPDTSSAAGLTAPVSPAEATAMAAAAETTTPTTPTTATVTTPVAPPSPLVLPAIPPAAAIAAVAPATEATPPVAEKPAAQKTAEAVPSSTTVHIPPASPGIVVSGANPPSLAPAAPAKEARAEKAALPPKEEPKAVQEPKTENKAENKAENEDAGDEKKPAAPADTSRVIIRATQNSWVMVVDRTGKALFDRVLKPGETFSVPNKPGLSLTTGNGAGVVVSLDGKEMPKVTGNVSRVVRNIPLDPDRLAADPGVANR